MKTLKQVKDEAVDRRRLAKEIRDKEVQAYLDAAALWTRPAEVNEELAERVRGLVKAGHVDPIGIACDVCGFELVAEHDFHLMSSPPCRWVNCGVCGDHSTQSSTDR